MNVLSGERSRWFWVEILHDKGSIWCLATCPYNYTYDTTVGVVNNERFMETTRS